jgi:quercetin dioxygenase-like cupin family protein
MSATGTLPDATVLRLAELITPTPHGIASRVLARSAGGNVTLFAFDKGESLSEHTTPFDALALTLDGALTLTIGGKRVDTTAGTIIRLRANVPHAVEASVASRMLLVMLKDVTGAS